VRPLVELVVRRGAPLPVVGYQIDCNGAAARRKVEAAWPAKRIAIVLDEDSTIYGSLVTDGWTVLPLRAWTPEKLYLAVL